jgi:ketosteroid isomerase-like protein
MIRILLAALAALALAAPAAAQHRAADAEALLAADRAFAAAAAHAATPADAIAAMLDAEAVMPAPPAGFAIGRDAILAALRAGPAWQSGTVSWAPIRGGVSADGTHGFTFGFLAVTAGDPARANRKYLAYWIHRAEGWRVVAWRQIPRQPGAASTDMLAPSLPAFEATPSADPARIAANQANLAAAEQAFSDRARTVGLRRAFREFGREDAMNMGGGAGFTLGAEAISRAVAGEEATSPVHWSTERSFVAASGDLGVSIGTIHTNAPAAADGRAGAFPFFTIWRRDTPDGPWRYIAE